VESAGDEDEDCDFTPAQSLWLEQVAPATLKVSSKAWIPWREVMGKASIQSANRMVFTAGGQEAECNAAFLESSGERGVSNARQSRHQQRDRCLFDMLCACPRARLIQRLIASFCGTR